MRNIIAIVQARMESTRFPGKVMQKVNGIPMIELLLTRLSKASSLNKIVLTTYNSNKNELLIKCVRNLGYEVFKGSRDDVLDRYYKTAKKFNATDIVRITGDCPLIDPDLVDELVNLFLSKKIDYVTNTNPPTFPDGLDVEIFTFNVLEDAWKNAKEFYDREHVTPYIRNSKKFYCENYKCDEDLSYQRWTVDEPPDMEVISNIFKYYYPCVDFGYEEVKKLSETHPYIFDNNQHLIRNEGAIMNTGQKLWKRAKHIIPGGNMLLSKRSEMFLPDFWPAYYSKSKGCNVWDLDGKKFIDMSLMGVGTNILGYSHKEVDSEVQHAITNGNMSTLNCPEEVYLSEKLIEMHPWSEMARLARTGGEANAIAIRIARAASGKDGVAVCGYHGWHDWYLSANLGNNEKLDQHLLPGLPVAGVPKSLKNTVHPFAYNDFEGLKNIVHEHDIGVIKMEVKRNIEPTDNFLEKVRTLATKMNIVLIFDECTSGFREIFGGLHKKYGVNPDMAIFGKALGNGYALTAVIGRREVMDLTQSTFISSTFWTERIGPVAGLATLKVMERDKSWETITKTGKIISQIWKDLAKENHLDIDISGIPSLSNFSLNYPNSLAYKTLITQEMMSQGFLAGTSVYACIEHNDEIINSYSSKMRSIFQVIQECEDGRNITELLNGPTCHSKFSRLN